MNRLKPCNMCRVVKPIDEYYKDPKSKDGHQGTCKVCKRLSYHTRSRFHRRDHDIKINQAKVDIENTDYINNAIDWLADMLAREITNAI